MVMKGFKCLNIGIMTLGYRVRRDGVWRLDTYHVHLNDFLHVQVLVCVPKSASSLDFLQSS